MCCMSFRFWSTECGERFLVQSEARCDAKNGNFTSESCDKADDATCSFRKGAINEKYTFFQWILQISGISGAKRVHKGIIGRPKRHIFHDFAFVPLSKSCFPPRAGSIVSEDRMIFCKKKVLQAWKAQRKQQIVYEINKNVAPMHTLIFADGALGAKNARDCSQKQYFDAGMERTNDDRNS